MTTCLANSMLAFIGPLGWTEMIVLALLGVLIFGKRLPEVGRGIGRSIVEFKKGLAGIDDEIEQAVRQPPHIESRTPAELEQPAQAPPDKETEPSAASHTRAEHPSA